MIRIPPLFALLLAGLAGPLVACGDDDGGGTTTVAGGADVERYCVVEKQLEAAGEEEFEALEKDPDASNEDFEAAERALVKENEDLLDEIQAVAPAEIRGDVEVLVEALRARAGLTESGPSSREEGEAELAVNDFEQDNCPNPGSLAP